MPPRKQILDGKSLGVCSKTRLVQNQLYLASKPNNSNVNAWKYKIRPIITLPRYSTKFLVACDEVDVEVVVDEGPEDLLDEPLGVRLGKQEVLQYWKMS